MVPSRPHADRSHTKPTQTAKDVLPSEDALIDIFWHIEISFRRLESPSAVPMTEMMKDIMVNIMVEVLRIFWLVTKEMKQGRASESIPNYTFPVPDRGSEKYLMKFIGRRDIEDALRRLDSLTREEIQMLLAQVIKVTHNVRDRVETVSGTKDMVQQASNKIGEDRPFPRPIRPQIFFGRDDELKTIIDLIFSSASAARIAILGPGGVGKTFLAHAVLTHEKVASHFHASRHLVPCESLTSRDALLVALARLLSLPLRPSADGYPMGLQPRVLSSLGSEKCILCLDSFESPWDQPGESRRAVEMLLADITMLPSVTMLITMRGRERPKATAWTLPMLRPLTHFPRDAAMRTWESLAGTCDEWAEKLIDAVDCLPLAVTLLGSLAEVSSAETLWERWQKENIALVEKEKGNKLASLEFSIALSIKSNRMATDGFSKRLLGILSMLPDGMPAFPSPEFRRLFPDIPDISRSLDTLLKCSLAILTVDKRVQVNSLVRFYCERNGIASLEDRRALRDYHVTLDSHDSNNPSHDSELSETEITSSPLNPHPHSQSLTLPSRASPTSPPIVTRGSLRSFGEREPSPVRDAVANPTQPTISIIPSTPLSITGTSADLPAVSLGGSAAPATSALALFLYASRTPSPSCSSARFPEHGKSHESDSHSSITLAEGYIHKRSVRLLPLSWP